MPPNALSTPSVLADFDPDLAAFWSFWNELPKEKLLPHLRDYLDNAPTRLQPSVAIIDVYTPEVFKLRLAGTQIVDAIGREPTETDSPSIYNEEYRKSAGLIAWTAVQHPVGYAAKREMRSHAGRVTLVHGIALPIRTDRSDCKTLINFSSLARSVAELEFQDRMATMEKMQPMQWIDIGAGAPTLTF